jgi:type IV secretory pathway VirB2 component (pilin)
MKSFRSFLARSIASLGAALPNPVWAASPAGASPILSAVTWMKETLLGEVASGVAVIAVAVVGFMMLSGRLNWRYGATVIVGCFVLFGAATIVGGIQSAAR